jgi:hypothetical protein
MSQSRPVLDLKEAKKSEKVLTRFARCVTLVLSAEFPDGKPEGSNGHLLGCYGMGIRKMRGLWVPHGQHHTDSTGVEVALHMLDTAEESRETLCFPCSLWSEDNC